jgi:hypothetical protein
VPIEIIEIAKLVFGIFVISLPGYFWSLLLFHEFKQLERIAFGFVLGLGVISCGSFMLEFVFGFEITKNLMIVLYLIYMLPAIILWIVSLRKKGFPKLHIDNLGQPKTWIILLILVFAAVMALLPHWSNGYFLPFHVDEWEHWTLSRAVMESGSSSITNPYIGSEIIRPLEIGFNCMTAGINWLTGSSFVTIFVFMPSIIAIFLSLMAFNIGERAERKFGLEAAFIVTLIPTTCRMMGPAFFVPLATGLLFLTAVMWIEQIRKLLAALFIPFFIFCIFLIHPPTALAGLIITLMYAFLLFLEKKYKVAVLSLGLSLLPIAFVFLISTRWDVSLQEVIEAFLGGKLLLDMNLPKIWPSFEHLGIITWVLFIIGSYFSFNKGKAIQRTITASAISFIVIIGLYDKLGYGVPVMYERSFMYLFLMVALIAGYGLSELGRLVYDNRERLISKRYERISNHSKIIISVAVCVILVIVAVPVHLDIQYYQMINEKEYETFTWIHDNIDSYRDENHTYDKAAVDPFAASPFSAVTELYIVSLSMSPLYGYSLHTEVENFLINKCVDTAFLDEHKISVIYGNCNNDNLTMIYSNVYLYPGLYEK